MDEKIILRNIKIYSFFTCIYLLTIVCLLRYLNVLYNIGKYISYPLMVVLTCAEILKYIISKSYSTDKKVLTRHKKNVRVNKIIQSIFVIALMTVIHYIVAVLFGAQLFHVFEETFMFSVMLTTLTVIPACIHLGSDKITYMFNNITPYEGDLISEFIFQNICCVYVGTWFGAFVIPLDWDRPWQVWPIPCSLGAMVGYFISHLSVMCGIPKNFRLSKRKTGKYDL